jgi:hypothetical protein
LGDEPEKIAGWVWRWLHKDRRQGLAMIAKKSPL